MSESALSSTLSRLDAVRDGMSVKRVFGDAYEADGVTVIPVASVRGGGGGGGGEGPVDATNTGSGAGMGYGLTVRPIGVYVIRDGNVTWTPSTDVLRIVIGGQLVAMAAILVAGRVLLRRKH